VKLIAHFALVKTDCCAGQHDRGIWQKT